jgi:hypothetical protein
MTYLVDNATSYAKQHNLPARKAEVRRALQRAFKEFNLSPSDVVLTRDEQAEQSFYLLALNLSPKRRFSKVEERRVTRLLNLYLAQNKQDVKETFRLLWSL